MMTASELAGALLPLLVQPPPMELRPRLAALQKGAERVQLRYEWVKNWDGFNALCEKSGWHLNDGQEWVSLYARVG